MSVDLDLFLSDEFAMFAEKIAAVKSEKKAKQEEIQELVQKAKKELAEIDAKGNELVAEFETFKKTKVRKD